MHTQPRAPAVSADFAPEPLAYRDDVDDGVVTLAIAERLAKARGALRTQPLQLIEWQRVVCDEAHVIRNPRTQAAQACFSLVSAARWALTGTPVQNKLDDLFALLKFLGVAPFAAKGFWTRFVSRPIKTRSAAGVETVCVDGAGWWRWQLVDAPPPPPPPPLPPPPTAYGYHGRLQPAPNEGAVGS